MKKLMLEMIDLNNGSYKLNAVDVNKGFVKSLEFDYIWRGYQGKKWIIDKIIIDPKEKLISFSNEKEICGDMHGYLIINSQFVLDNNILKNFIIEDKKVVNFFKEKLNQFSINSFNFNPNKVNKYSLKSVQIWLKHNDLYLINNAVYNKNGKRMYDINHMNLEEKIKEASYGEFTHEDISDHMWYENIIIFDKNGFELDFISRDYRNKNYKKDFLEFLQKYNVPIKIAFNISNKYKKYFEDKGVKFI